MSRKNTARNLFTGRWHIISMSAWDKDYLHEEIQAYIEFEKNGIGRFQFGYVQGQTDCRITDRQGKPVVEFTWEGGDCADGTPLTGRGWAILEGDELKGMICIHLGDDSKFVAKKAEKQPSKARR